MIISLALLGYGASGTFIALLRERLEPRFESAFASCALLSGVSMLAAFAVGQRVPFNALEIVWDARELGYLALMYLVYFVPFFFAACCIGLALTCRSQAVGGLYFFDLVGAGTGAALIVGALFAAPPAGALFVPVGLALAASLVVRSPHRQHLRIGAAQLACLALAAAVALRGGPAMHISEYKGLSQALEVVDSRVLETSSSPLGLLTVVESPTVPLRLAPGLSFSSRHVPPEQLAVFTDADGVSAINRYDGDPESAAFLRDTTAALPYRLLDEPEVLVLGAGGGSDVLMALIHDARRIDAVELDPRMRELVASTHADYAGHIYDDPRVTVHTAEARGFVAAGKGRYDLVQIGLLDSFAASGAGVQALNESYLYSVEAFGQYLARLEPDGLLAITRWIKSPPRDSLKLAATAIDALSRAGADPAQSLAVIRSWNTVTLVARNGAFAQEEIDAIRAFAKSRSFDTAYFPGIRASDANRYNLLEEPWLYDGIQAFLFGDARAFYANYKFHVEPATDDRPYFFNFFKWRTVPEVLALRDAGGAGLIEWAYLVVVATLIQAATAGSVLILLPLARIRRTWTGGLRYGTYFLLLGLAFLFVEIAFIQKFILFLHHPLYAVAVVLAGFLVFAGLGSAASSRLARNMEAKGWSTVAVAAAGIALIAGAYLVLLPPLFNAAAGLSDPARILVSVALIAPLAVLMGMPFPLGLRRVATDAPGFLPWAWGINGFASVLSAVLATLLAIHFGFSAVIAIAILLYAAAAALRVA
jgi:spermidine synthase